MYGVKDIELTDYLKLKHIELDLKEQEKPAVIEELVDLIAESGAVKNKKALLAAIIERERLGSTAIGNGVAMPHVRIDGVTEALLAFGRSVHGVDFNSLDGEKTHIFFIFISPKDDVEGHLKILAKISRLVKDKFHVSRLKKAKNKKEIVDIIAHIEKQTR